MECPPPHVCVTGEVWAFEPLAPFVPEVQSLLWFAAFSSRDFDLCVPKNVHAECLPLTEELGSGVWLGFVGDLKVWPCLQMSPGDLNPAGSSCLRDKHSYPVSYLPNTHLIFLSNSFFGRSHIVWRLFYLNHGIYCSTGQKLLSLLHSWAQVICCYYLDLESPTKA